MLVAEFSAEKMYTMEHPQIVAEFNEICNPKSESVGFWISKEWLKGSLSYRDGRYAF